MCKVYTNARSKELLYVNGVAKTMKKLRISKGDYWIKQWVSTVASLFKCERLLKERISSQRERILSFMSSSL